MKTNKTQFAILGMLSISPMSGYDMRQNMQKSTGHFWSESDGQLYPTLNKLTTLGLASYKTNTSGAHEKKVYQITSKGLTELKKWLAQSPETHLVRSEFMLQLFFGANISPEVSLEHIQAHRYHIKNALTQLLETKKEIKNPDSPHAPYWIMSIDYGIQMAQAKLKWCDEVSKKLHKIQKGKTS